MKGKAHVWDESRKCKKQVSQGTQRPQAVYVQPKLAKRERLIEVTESEPMVITP